MKVHVADHPLINHKLTVLRDERTDSPTFRRLVEELVTLLAYEATRDVRTHEVAEELLEIADIPMPEEDEEPGPVGHLEILADLGMNGMEISALCDDEELFPDEQLEAIASRLGFGQDFSELLDL